MSEEFSTSIAVRYMYYGTFPMMYLVALHLKSEGYEIISTHAFSKIRKYPRYVNLLGEIRNEGGFDLIVYHRRDSKELPIGVEVKPEFSFIEFKHALGQTIADLTFAIDKVREAMIIMPHKNLATENCLKNRFNYVLKNLGCPVSMKYLSMACRPYHG